MWVRCLPSRRKCFLSDSVTLYHTGRWGQGKGQATRWGSNPGQSARDRARCGGRMSGQQVASTLTSNGPLEGVKGANIQKGVWGWSGVFVLEDDLCWFYGCFVSAWLFTCMATHLEPMLPTAESTRTWISAECFFAASWLGCFLESFARMWESPAMARVSEQVSE